MKALIFYTLCTLLIISCRQKPAADAAPSGIYYTCSMHPQVHETHPGNCPICHMKLTPVKEGASDKLYFSAEEMALAHITTKSVSYGNISSEFVFPARVAADDNLASAVSAKTAGRIEKLAIKTTGTYIKKGDLLYTFYSEPIITAEKEYLATLEKFNTLKDPLVDYAPILNAQKTRLSLLGLTDLQINQLSAQKTVAADLPVFSNADGYITDIKAAEGDAASEGQVIFVLNTLQSVWVNIEVFSSDIHYFSIGQTVDLQSETWPGERLSAKVSYINPELTPASRTVLVRIELNNPGLKFRPGMQATAILKTGGERGLAIPAESIVREGDKEYVWVQGKDGGFSRKAISTGRHNTLETEVLSGLQEGETIAATGAYLINSEYHFKTGNMGQMDMKGMDMGQMK